MSIVDVPSLVNGGKLFVGLSMTCLTSQFAAPAVRVRSTNCLCQRQRWRGGDVGAKRAERSARPRLSAKGLYQPVAQFAAQQPAHGRLWSRRGTAAHLPAQGFARRVKTFIVLGDPLTQVRTNVGFEISSMPVTQK